MTPRDRLLKQFRELVGVRLERINRAIVELESTGSVETGRKALRELHGLKGEARMMGYDSINVLVHEMEELVKSSERAQYLLSHDSADALLKSADAVTVLSGVVASDAAPEVEKLVAWLRERTRLEQGQHGSMPEPVVLPPIVPKTGTPGAGQPTATQGPAPSAPQPPAPAPGAPAPRFFTPIPIGQVALPSGPQSTSSRAPGTPPGATPSGGTAQTAKPAAPAQPAQAPSRPATSNASGPASTAGSQQGASAQPPRQEPRADSSVRIEVSSLDMLTSSATNLLQVSRRRELANGRRLTLARELAQLAREAEDLGPAGSAFAAKLNKAKDLAAALHREAKLLANEELRDLGQVVEEVQAFCRRVLLAR